jgi:hypothetical protein
MLTEKERKKRQRARVKRWRVANSEKVRAQSAKWRAANLQKVKNYHKQNPEKHKATVAKWRAKNPERVKKILQNAKLKRYGITFEQYTKLSVTQNGVCAICRKPETWIQKGTLSLLSVDHDHVTSKVRGLLCHSCNVGLGHFKDDALTLRAAASYLEETR